MIEERHAGDIVILSLRHGKVNVLDLELLAELKKKVEGFKKSDIRGLILTGVGSCFSAGIDLFRIVNEGEDYVKDFYPQLIGTLRTLFEFPKPAVAAINGHAIAGGAILAWACDHTIMARSGGRIGVPELLVGVPIPSLPLEIVRFAVPQEQFQTLVYSGKTHDAEQAGSKGLVHEITQPETLSSQALQVVKQYASVPETAFALTKQIMRHPVLERSERLRGSLDKQALKIWMSENTRQRIQKYLEKTVGPKENGKEFNK